MSRIVLMNWSDWKFIEEKILKERNFNVIGII